MKSVLNNFKVAYIPPTALLGSGSCYPLPPYSILIPSVVGIQWWTCCPTRFHSYTSLAPTTHPICHISHHSLLCLSLGHPGWTTHMGGHSQLRSGWDSHPREHEIPAVVSHHLFFYPFCTGLHWRTTDFASVKKEPVFGPTNQCPLGWSATQSRPSLTMWGFCKDQPMSSTKMLLNRYTSPFAHLLYNWYAIFVIALPGTRARCCKHPLEPH